MKYKVRVREVYAFDVEVDADSPNHARQLVYEMDRDNSYPDKEPTPEYEYTLDTDKWRVQDENGVIKVG